MPHDELIVIAAETKRRVGIDQLCTSPERVTLNHGMFDTLAVTGAISFDDGRVRLSPCLLALILVDFGGLMAMMVLDGLVRPAHA